MTKDTSTMAIDEVMPDFDATIAEHIVVDAPPDVVYRVTREMDFLEVHSPIVDAAMFARGLPAEFARRFGNRPAADPPAAMRLSDMFDREAGTEAWAGWTALGEVEGRELVFGSVGKVWQADIDWKPVPPDAFAAFDEPDYAKIAAGFSIRPYGKSRTLLSYEARTQGTDAAAAKKFLRYWKIVRRFVAHVMRAAVVTAKDLAEDAGTDDSAQVADH